MAAQFPEAEGFSEQAARLPKHLFLPKENGTTAGKKEVTGNTATSTHQGQREEMRPQLDQR